eukprot:gb/GECG01000215.1/.p1 GENE.gb/GECG01000215.1/~~gb/GECG01000215.1/.p1  ORF type:complete len:239 (+),score=33.83 gb/GECG01000215.1/:1-717(+)
MAELLDLLESSLKSYVNYDELAQMYIDSLSNAAGSSGVNERFSEEVVRLENQVLGKNFESGRNQFRYDHALACRSLEVNSRTLFDNLRMGSSRFNYSVFYFTHQSAQLIGESVLLGLEDGTSTRTVAAPFASVPTFCDRNPSVAVFSRRLAGDVPFEIAPSAQHGVGVSDLEFEDCGQDPVDTSTSPRALSKVKGKATDATTVIAEEYADPPSDIPPGASIKEAGKKINYCRKKAGSA